MRKCVTEQRFLSKAIQMLKLLTIPYEIFIGYIMYNIIVFFPVLLAKRFLTAWTVVNMICFDFRKHLLVMAQFPLW